MCYAAAIHLLILCVLLATMSDASSTLFIQHNNNPSISIDVNATSTIGDLKREIREILCIDNPFTQIKLIFGNRIINNDYDNTQLSDIGICSQTILNIDIHTPTHLLLENVNIRTINHYYRDTLYIHSFNITIDTNRFFDELQTKIISFINQETLTSHDDDEFIFHVITDNELALQLSTGLVFQRYYHPEPLSNQRAFVISTNNGDTRLQPIFDQTHQEYNSTEKSRIRKSICEGNPRHINLASLFYRSVHPWTEIKGFISLHDLKQIYDQHKIFTFHPDTIWAQGFHHRYQVTYVAFTLPTHYTIIFPHDETESHFYDWNNRCNVL